MRFYAFFSVLLALSGERNNANLLDLVLQQLKFSLWITNCTIDSGQLWAVLGLKKDGDKELRFYVL
ncbi:hypothetical protein Sjap_008256 [Stephania japonica]|uniref:Uncharacterized protein n=1 Tax=Stephania japonica TaxID=461633 RepID=A0AAP0PB65_9MAGN